MEPGVLQATLGQPLGVRGAARTAEGARRAEADVVEQDDQNVRAPPGGRSGSIGGKRVSGSLAS